MDRSVKPLPFLQTHEAFPELEQAWGLGSPAPGLLAAGADLGLGRLEIAYRQGIFPWFSEGQPILWWSPDPRMVLQLKNFKLHRSLRKVLAEFLRNPLCEIRVNHDFEAVIAACAAPRAAQAGTWILPEMQRAYIGLHHAGMAHSIETWINGQLAGGLYCTAIGQAVFGESMFTRVPDASKIALCALVALCKTQGATWIDCQQNTAHLASLGAAPMPRSEFCEWVAHAADQAALSWRLQHDDWKNLDARLL